MDRTNQWLCEASALELVAVLERGEATSEQIVTALIERIELIDPAGSELALRSVLAIAPDALDSARVADYERSSGIVRSALHGVPIMIKDNIEARGLPGTAGSTSLLGRPVREDSPLVARLRRAGMVILASTNLSQWANLRSPRSTSGWSAVGGLTVNPYRLDRSAGGSSSGSGVALAARLSPLTIGTETDGSITCPASLNGVVGLKPAVGTISSEGIVPISGSQDSAGPMARTVDDVAALFEVLSERPGFVATVHRGARNLKVGVATNLLTKDPRTDELFHACARALRSSGVRTIDITVAEANAQVDADEMTVLLAEMCDDLGTFLKRRGGDGPSSVAEIIDFELAHADEELAFFGHEYLVQSVSTGGRTGPDYRAARERNVEWATKTCLSPALDGVDCFIAPCYSPAWKNDLTLGGSGSARWSQVTQAPAIAGWPVATVPMGLIDGLPVGLSIVGPPGSEAALLGVALEVERTLGLVADKVLVPSYATPQRA